MSTARLLNCSYADQWRFSRSRREWCYSTTYQYKCLNKPGLPISNPGSATALNLAFFEAIQKPTKEFLTNLLNEEPLQGWAIHSIGQRRETSQSPIFQYHNSDYYDHHFEFEVIIIKEIAPVYAPMGQMGILYEALRTIQVPQKNDSRSQGKVVGEIEDVSEQPTPPAS